MKQKFKRKKSRTKDNPEKNLNLPTLKLDDIVGNGNGNGNGNLTEKQRRFVDEYLKDLNITKAAVRAGYSKNTAYMIGRENLDKPKIIAAIRRRQEELQEQVQIDQVWVLERYKRLTEYTISDFFDDNGNLKEISQIPRDKLYAVCGFKADKKIITSKDKKQIVETLTREFKLPNKKEVLDSIGRHLGMFEKDNKQKDGGRFPIPAINFQVNILHNGGETKAEVKRVK